MVNNLNSWAVKFIHKTPLISSWSSAGSMKSIRLKQKKAQVGSSASWPSAQSIVQKYWKKSGPTGKIKKLRLGSNEANFTPGCGSHSGYQPQMLPWRGDVGPKAKFLDKGPSEVDVWTSCSKMLSFRAFANLSLLPHLILNWQRFACTDFATFSGANIPCQKTEPESRYVSKEVNMV